jgi:hypothetical protein
MKALESSCRSAIEEMDEVDNDDAGVNNIGFIGRFWGLWWYVTQAIDYEPDPELIGSYSIVVSESEPIHVERVFAFCVHQELLTKRKPSPKRIATFIEAWQKSHIHKSMVKG